MLILFLKFKTVWTVCCYGLRHIFRGIIVKEFRTPIKKIGIDLCYIALIFFGFNVTQTEPPSRFNTFSAQLVNKFPTVEKNTHICLFLFICVMFWILALYFYHKKYQEPSYTKLGLIRRHLFLMLTYAIGCFLFFAAVQTQ